MPNAFVITASTNTVTLDATRKATASMTVSNTTGRPVRARLDVTPTSPTRPEWITVQGGPERDLPLGGSQQVTVGVAVPPDVAEGAYGFRLDVVAEDQPEEDFAQGPELTIQVPAPPPTPKRFPWWIVAVAAGVVIVGALIIWLIARGGGDGKPKTVAVPDVVGKSLQTAVNTLKDADLKAQVAVDPTKSPECAQTVVLVVPDPGAPVQTKSNVALFVHPRPANIKCLKITGPFVTISPDRAGRLLTTTTTGP